MPVKFVFLRKETLTAIKENIFGLLLTRGIKNKVKILDKKSGKINTIILKGPSNAGKTRIANSLKYAFKTYADISQDIANNFWLEGALGKIIIAHEEARFNEENQEDVKRLMERADMTVHRKGLTDAYLKHNPYFITCNTWPWCRFLEEAHIRAFKNRSYIIRCETDSKPEVFADGGDLDPRVWLDILQGKETPPDGPMQEMQEEFHFDSCNEDDLCMAASVLDEDLSQAQAAQFCPTPSDTRQIIPNYTRAQETKILKSLDACPYGCKTCPAFVQPQGIDEVSNIALCFACEKEYYDSSCSE